jgi:hypothetical protein
MDKHVLKSYRFNSNALISVFADNILNIIDNNIFYLPKDDMYFKKFRTLLEKNKITVPKYECSRFKKNGKYDVKRVMRTDYQVIKLLCVLLGLIRFTGGIYYEYNKIEASFIHYLYILDLTSNLDLKYIYTEPNSTEIFIFYKENMEISLFYLFVETYKINNKDIFTKLEKKFLYHYLIGKSDKILKYEIILFLCMNFPNKFKKKYNTIYHDKDTVFSYKKDYENKFKFFTKNEYKYVDKYYANIKNKSLNKLNKYIYSSEFNNFYHKNKTNVKTFKFNKKFLSFKFNDSILKK